MEVTLLIKQVTGSTGRRQATVVIGSDTLTNVTGTHSLYGKSCTSTFNCPNDWPKTRSLRRWPTWLIPTVWFQVN